MSVHTSNSLVIARLSKGQIFVASRVKHFDFAVASTEAAVSIDEVYEAASEDDSDDDEYDDQSRGHAAATL